MSQRSKSLPSDFAAAEAAAWFARRRSGSWSKSDAREFVAWLKADPSHTAVWASYDRLWGRFETVRDDPKILAMRERARRSSAKREVLRRHWLFAASMTASVVLGVFVWREVRAPVAPPLPLVESTVASPNVPLEMIRDASTQIGERSFLVLPDGSKITLNTGSAVHTDFSGHERRVTLVRGEAFFDVAKDRTRPFIVQAGSRRVIAVGTAFDVRLQEREMKVTLVEGKVKVVQTAIPGAGDTARAQVDVGVELEAGSSLMTREDGTERIEHLDAVRATSWTSGKLVFDGERLADVVAEMNRYSHERLEIGDPALNEKQVSGVFEPTSGPAFAKALEEYGIVRASRRTATTIVLDSP